jgi:hypothetical protein
MKWGRLTTDLTRGDAFSATGGHYTCEGSTTALVSKPNRAASQVTLTHDALQLLYALGCGCSCRAMKTHYHCGCGCSHCSVLQK